MISRYRLLANKTVEPASAGVVLATRCNTLETRS